MSRQCAIEIHPERRKIEVLLAANVNFSTINMQFGISKFASCRYRQRMKANDRRFFSDLRRAAAAAGISRASYRFTPAGSLRHD